MCRLCAQGTAYLHLQRAPSPVRAPKHDLCDGAVPYLLASRAASTRRCAAPPSPWPPSSSAPPSRGSSGAVHQEPSIRSNPPTSSVVREPQEERQRGVKAAGGQGGVRRNAAAGARAAAYRQPPHHVDAQVNELRPHQLAVSHVRLARAAGTLAQVLGRIRDAQRDSLACTLRNSQDWAH